MSHFIIVKQSPNRTRTEMFLSLEGWVRDPWLITIFDTDNPDDVIQANKACAYYNEDERLNKSRDRRSIIFPREVDKEKYRTQALKELHENH